MNDATRLASLPRSDAETELGIARFLEQYARLSTALRRRGELRPSDAHTIARTIGAIHAILRFHLQKSLLYAAVGLDAARTIEADRRLKLVSGSIRRQLLPLRAVASLYPFAVDALGEISGFYERTTETRSAPPGQPPPPWIHPKVRKQ